MKNESKHVCAKQVRYVSEGSRKILELDSKTVLERSQQLIEKKKRLQEVCLLESLQVQSIYIF